MDTGPCDHLDDYLAGGLSADEAARFEAHLADCPACREEVAHGQRIDRLLAQGSRRLEPVPPSLVDRIEREGWTVRAAAEAAGISQRTACKWLARWRLEGEAGLVDRSSAPGVVVNRTAEQTVAVIAALRRLRMTGPQIAETLDRPVSTVSGILTRIGMGRLGRLGLEPAERYERAVPGELVHIDVKKLGRIEGGAGKR